MKYIIVKRNNNKFFFKVNRLDFEDIPKYLQQIDEDITILYKDNEGKSHFLAKYVKNVMKDDNNILKNRLLNHVKGKSFNTYELKHDENTSNLYDIIKQHSKEAEQYFKEEKEKELDFHFFYNETILNHRDCLYESLRSLHILQHEEVKGLFVSQKANGIMGMSDSENNIVKQLYKQGKIDQRLFNSGGISCLTYKA